MAADFFNIPIPKNIYPRPNKAVPPKNNKFSIPPRTNPDNPTGVAASHSNGGVGENECRSEKVISFVFTQHLVHTPLTELVNDYLLS